MKGTTEKGTADGDQAENAEEEEYDPHLHREVKKPTTNVETLIHLLKGSFGTGILAMPEALKFAGMINGIISTVLIGALCTYTIHLLVRSQYILCKKLKVPLLTYPESMKVACEVGPPCLRKFAPFAPHLTDFFLVFFQLGICCVYIVFVGVNIKAVADVYTKPTELAKEIYMLFFFVPFLLILSLRNLKILAPFSFVANLITLVTYIVVVYYICQNLRKFSDLPAFGSVFSYPLYFGTTLFALQAVGVHITAENNMKTPKSFRGTFGILNIAMVIVITIYVLIAMLGYWKYGDDIEPSITLNFPKEEILAQSVKIMYSAAIYISYGLQGFVAVQILWDNYIEKRVKSKPLLWEYVLRFSCVVLTFILSTTIPLLGPFISLVGAFCLSALGIIFPATLEICACWPDNLGYAKWVLIKDIILIIIGIVGLLSGTYACLDTIIRVLSSR